MDSQRPLVVDFLLAQKAHVRLYDAYRAIAVGNTEIFKKLIGARPHLVKKLNDFGENLLFSAVGFNRKQIYDFMVEEYAAQTNIKNIFGHTPSRSKPPASTRIRFVDGEKVEEDVVHHRIHQMADEFEKMMIAEGRFKKKDATQRQDELDQLTQENIRMANYHAYIRTCGAL